MATRYTTALVPKVPTAMTVGSTQDVFILDLFVAFVIRGLIFETPHHQVTLVVTIAIMLLIPRESRAYAFSLVAITVATGRALVRFRFPLTAMGFTCILRLLVNTVALEVFHVGRREVIAAKIEAF